MRSPQTIDRLSHDELAELAHEYLLAGHLIDRAGMPVVVGHGLDMIRDVAIDEWMGASPIYAKRLQRLLGFEGNTVEVALKGFQFDIGSPPEFMDFRLEVHDDHHGEFHLAHCGALMDVEPLGRDYVVTMCHHIEDPTFDATGWATNSRLRMRPVHRPPRLPADRRPHCSWVVEIDPHAAAMPMPAPAQLVSRSAAANLPLSAATGAMDDGAVDYRGPLDPNLRLGHFASGTLRSVIDEVSLQGHLLVLAFGAAVARRLGTEAAAVAAVRQFTGVGGVVAERLSAAFGLTDNASDLATVFELHPAFHPRSYVNWRVALDSDVVHLELGPCAAIEQQPFTSWIGGLAEGHDAALAAIAIGVDPHWTVHREASRRWTVVRGAESSPEPDEVTLTKLSTGRASTSPGEHSERRGRRTESAWSSCDGADAEAGQVGPRARWRPAHRCSSAPGRRPTRR